MPHSVWPNGVGGGGLSGRPRCVRVDFIEPHGADTGGVAFVDSAPGVGLPANSNFLAVRLNADGWPDATFGADGRATTSFGVNNSSTAYALVVQSDGKLVLAGGEGVNQTQHFALARFSNDFNQSYVDHVYLDLLGRAADSAGESYFTAALSQAHLNRAQVAKVLTASEDFYAGVGAGTNARYVTALYRALFSRELDPGGAANWIHLLDTGRSRVRVVAEMMTAPEFVVDEVDQFYAELLNRAPDATGLAYFQEALAAGLPPEQADWLIASSQEYFAGR